MSFAGKSSKLSAFDVKAAMSMDKFAAYLSSLRSVADRKKVFTAQKMIAKFLDEELGVKGIVEFTHPTVKTLVKRYCEHQMRNVWFDRINKSGSFEEKDAADIRCFIMGELLLLFKSRNWMTAMTFGDFKQFFKDEGFRFEGYGLNAIIPRRMAALLKSYSLKIRPLIVKAMTADSVKFFAEHRLGGNIVSLKGILFYVDSFSGATYNIQLDNVEKADFVMPPPQSDPSLPAPPLKTQAPTASAFVVAKTAALLDVAPKIENLTPRPPLNTLDFQKKRRGTVTP